MIAIAVRILVGLAVAATGLGPVGGVTAVHAGPSGQTQAPAVQPRESSHPLPPEVMLATRGAAASPDAATTTSPPSAPDETVEATEPPSGDGTSAETARSQRGTTLAYTLAGILAVIGAVGLALARWR